MVRMRNSVNSGKVVAWTRLTSTFQHIDRSVGWLVDSQSINQLYTTENFEQTMYKNCGVARGNDVVPVPMTELEQR